MADKPNGEMFPVIKNKEVRPDGGIWLGDKITSLSEFQPSDKVKITIEVGKITIEKA